MLIIDNINKTVKEDLQSGIQKGSKMSVAAACFSIYAYGIRHGGIDFKNAPSEDAKYMLISCSAFINYLIEKYSKLGGTT